MIRLGSICSFLNGGTPSRQVTRYYQGDIPWITGADISGTLASTARSFITEEAIRESATNRVPVGTVLLVTRTSVGKVAVSTMELCFSQDITAIMPDANFLDTPYLVHFLRTKQPHFERLARGATIKGVTREAVANLAIPLPPLAEQRRIAEILDKADALRAKRHAALAQLDTLVHSIFLDMFGDPVSNQKGWKEHEVEKVCRLVRGSSPRPKGDPKYYGGPVRRLMVSDITRDGFWVTPRIDSLTEAGAKRSRRVPAGTVVMAVSGEVGVVATVQDPCCVHDGFVAFLDLDESVFDSCFFMFLFHSLKMTHERRKAGAIFENLTTRDVKAMRLPTPTIDLQRSFAAIVQSVERQKALQRTQLVELDTLFASLQSNAFRGNSGVMGSAVPLHDDGHEDGEETKALGIHPTGHQ